MQIRGLLCVCACRAVSRRRQLFHHVCLMWTVCLFTLLACIMHTHAEYSVLRASIYSPGINERHTQSKTPNYISATAADMWYEYTIKFEAEA